MYIDIEIKIDIDTDIGIGIGIVISIGIGIDLLNICEWEKQATDRRMAKGMEHQLTEE